MSALVCKAAIGDDTLIEYWLGELDETAGAHLDEHLIACPACSERLSGILALADATRDAFRHGMIYAFVTDAFAKSAARRLTRVREYRVPHNGSVNCTVAPDDELLLARLEAPLAGVTRLDAVAYVDEAQTAVFEDIPFDSARGEVVLAPRIADLRIAPSHRQRVRLIAVDDAGQRVVGDYTFHHAARGP